jgi:hypothetical protein
VFGLRRWFGVVDSHFKEAICNIAIITNY